MKAILISRFGTGLERMLNECKTGKKYSTDFWPYGPPIKAMILPFQKNFSPPDIQQQSKHLLHGYELDDKTLQKAQLEPHKIFPEFSHQLLLLSQRAPNRKSSQLKDKVTLTTTLLRLFDTKANNTF